MKNVFEFKIENKEIKKYLEECLEEEKIDYEMKIEDRWIQKYKQASKFYQVYCLYVDDNNIDKVKKITEDYENGTIITDGIEELKNIEIEKDNRFNNITQKNFLKYYFIAIIIIGILIIIGTKLFS